MKILRRRVRRSFLFAAIGFLILGIADIANRNYAEHGVSPLHHYVFIAFCLSQGVLYAAAWFTTRTPSPYRSDWAVAASVFTLAYSGYDLWLNHTNLVNARGGFIGLILAIAGLYVFAPGGSPAAPQSAAGSPSQSATAQMQADAQTPAPAATRPLGERVTARAFRIPAEGSASSAALAAAAVDAADPSHGRWDPVSSIRASASTP